MKVKACRGLLNTRAAMIAAVLLASAFPSTRVTAETGVILGHVFNATNQQPIVGLHINLYQGPDPDIAGEDAWDFVSWAKSDGSGYYSFSGLSARCYAVRTMHSSDEHRYLPERVYNIRIIQGTSVTVDLNVRAAGYIYGYVYDRSSQPLPNAIVWTTSRRYGQAADPNGRYEVLVPPTAERLYPVSCISREGHVPQNSSMLYAGELTGTRGPDFHLVRGGALKGRLTTEGGTPIPWCEAVNWHRPNSDIWVGSHTDENGEFLLSGISPDTDIYLVTEGWETYEVNGKRYMWGERSLGPFSVAAGETTELPTLTVPEAGTVSGTVTDRNGMPLSGVSVGMIGTDDMGGSVWLADEEDVAASDEQGHYHLQAPPGTYSFLVSKEGYEFQSGKTTVVSGCETVCDLELSAIAGYFTVTGYIDDFAAIAPRNQDGVVLPYEVVHCYQYYGIPREIGVVAWAAGVPWEQLLLPYPDAVFTAKGTVEDGYTDDLEASALPDGSFRLTLPAGSHEIVSHLHGPEDGNGYWALLSEPVGIHAVPGQLIDGITLTFHTGTGSIEGRIIFPEGKGGAFTKESVFIRLRQPGSETLMGRAVAWPSPDGNYVIEQLPAGTYYLYAVTVDFDPFISDTFTLSDGQTVIRDIIFGIPGDANLDCRVNILDLLFVRNRMLQDVSSGDNWQADVNQDGSINILDLLYVRNRMNDVCP